MSPATAWRGLPALAGRYQLLEQIGAGGMARVFRARDTQLAREVAVKLFHTAQADPDAARRQLVEVRTLARLTHPHLVTIFDAELAASPGQEAHSGFLVTELVRGPSLSLALAEGLAPARLAVIGAEVADALAYVHAAGVVHRDVTPSNVLLTAAEPTGSAKLVDFGIAQLADATRLTRAGLTLGTAAFLSPEQVRGGAVTGASDVYALGLVLLEGLTGTRAYDGPPVEAAMARLVAPPPIPDWLDARWRSLLRAMTALDPAGRPDAATVAARLRSPASTTQVLPVLVDPERNATLPVPVGPERNATLPVQMNPERTEALPVQVDPERTAALPVQMDPEPNAALPVPLAVPGGRAIAGRGGGGRRLLWSAVPLVALAALAAVVVAAAGGGAQPQPASPAVRGATASPAAGATRPATRPVVAPSATAAAAPAVPAAAATGTHSATPSVAVSAAVTPAPVRPVAVPPAGPKGHGHGRGHAKG